MLLIILAFVGGLFVERYVGVIGRAVDFAKSVWAKIRNKV